MKEKIAELLKKPTKLKKDEIMNLIEVPKDSKLGDYSFPCFALSKSLKKNPVEIAKDIVGSIENTLEFEKVEAVGPYINIFINRNVLAESVLQKVQKERDKYGSSKAKKEKTVLEFPSPNTNKPLHLGHVRNIVLGQSASNILKFSGDDVKIVNLNNDRGVHICKSMIAYEKFGKGETPEKSRSKSDHFVGDYYVKFAVEAAKDKSLEEAAQECLVKWESGDKATLELWKKMNKWALAGFNETYKKFGLNIDKSYFESKIYKSGKDIINAQLKKKIVQKKEDGAIFIDLNDKSLGEKILLRADGTSIYITQDIYLAILKQKEYKFSKSIYISAREQDHHFKVLFEILRRFGYGWAGKLQHLSYGMVNLESGRMKSREGNVVDADDIIDEMKNLALEGIEKRWKDISKSEKEKRAAAIAMAAIRYYFLKVDKTRDLTFKPEESLAFEGDTGPYLLYSYARAKSILEKAKYNSKKKYSMHNLNDLEKNMVSQLGKFPKAVESAYNDLAPNLIANYAFETAQLFNEFYHANQVIGSENEQFRLVLVDSFSQVLKNALNLLGIPVIEKM